MDWIIDNDWGQWLQNLAALATIAAAGVAAWALWSAKNDAREATRPSVVAELEPDPLSGDRANLVIRNYGVSPAHNLRVTFEPDPLVISDNRPRGMADALANRYKSPIVTLPPGRQLTNVYWDTHWEGDDHDNRLPLPETLAVKVEYTSRRGKRDIPYSDTFRLAMSQVQGETRTNRTTDGKEQDRMAVALEALARGLGRQ